MKKCKKLMYLVVVAVLLGFVLMIGIVVSPVGTETVKAAVQTDSDPGLIYEERNGGITIIGYTGTPTMVNIPTSYSGHQGCNAPVINAFTNER